MKLFYVGAGPSPRLLVRSGDRPNHLAATAIVRAYVVEGHASACPRTVALMQGWGVDVSHVYVVGTKTFSLCQVQVKLQLKRKFS